MHLFHRVFVRIKLLHVKVLVNSCLIDNKHDINFNYCSLYYYILCMILDTGFFSNKTGKDFD